MNVAVDAVVSQNVDSAEQFFKILLEAKEIEEGPFAFLSTSKSTSLSDRSSPRATEPNTRTVRAPWRAANAENLLAVLLNGHKSNSNRLVARRRVECRIAIWVDWGTDLLD